MKGASDEIKGNDKKDYCCSVVNINVIDSVTDELQRSFRKNKSSKH